MMLALILIEFPAQEALLKSPEKAGSPAAAETEQPMCSLSPATVCISPIAPSLPEPQGQSFTHNVHLTPSAVPGVQVAKNTCSVNNRGK